jgi:hypothetical protein
VEKMDKARMDLKTGTYIEPNKTTLGDWVLKRVKIYAKQRVCITSSGSRSKVRNRKQKAGDYFPGFTFAVLLQ